MSEEQRITKVEKEKDPRKVESGKRLAAASKAAREKKNSNNVEKKEEMNYAEEEPKDAGTETNYMLIITGIGVISGLVCLYFTYKQDKRETPVKTQPRPEVVRPSDDRPAGVHNQLSNRVGNGLHSLDD